ncbi:ribonuclease R [Lichenifustis flavocetrariae]|uniref:Ribonuclease R n=1 Tax=Lichenifustis flavocetrariae TaxID=2949735 RepID=A0AA42CI74_9HYPH|nr:ribonuclease R [Lichenifustis flavocetrariae]MCW6508059.1 ribonuclease R [Lichenifustis flavocetrariae]
MSASTPLPTKAEILALIAQEVAAAKESGRKPAPLGKRELARAFGIKGSDRAELKRVLRELQEEGALEKRRKSLRGAGSMPTVLVADITGRDRDGDLVAVPNDWDTAELGAAPRILIDLPRKPRPGAPVPGVGNRVLVRIAPADDPDATHAVGRVIKILERQRSRMLGVFHDRSDGGLRVSPVDKKAAAQEWTVPPEFRGEAVDGDLVAIEPIGRGTPFGLQLVRVVERLGSLKSEKAVSMIAIQIHDVPSVFRPEALSEAEAAEAPTLAGREDWRALPLVTIDPPDAKDHDDAVHAEADPAEDNAGGFIVTVAIADVAALVRPGTALDREALDRGNSVYFPDRVVPMLPERISTDLGSLRPQEDRPALAVRMVIGADGRKRRHSFHRVMMRSHAKLNYAQAQQAIDGAPDDTAAPLVEPVLRPLWAAYEATARARDERGPLDLDLPERKILLKPDGTVDRVVVPQRLAAHRLIEEFMILANVAAAEALEAKQQSLIYRVHDEPTIAKLNALSEFLATIGIRLAKGQALRPAQFNGILERVRGSEHEHLVNEVVLRSQAQAEYAAENYGHFGLNLRRYAHFTSPIRRYADLVVHRALIRALGLGSDGLPDFSPAQLGEIAARISAAERRAMAAERETIDRLIAGFLVDKIGATFEGRISGVTRAGLFLKLTETGADGFVPASTLGDEYFRFDEARRAMVGTRSGKAYRLGDIVEAKLLEAAPFAGALRFGLVGPGGRLVRGRTSDGRAGDDKTAGRKTRGRSDSAKAKMMKTRRK